LRLCQLLLLLLSPPVLLLLLLYLLKLIMSMHRRVLSFRSLDVGADLSAV
jgi:hypothetical protein